jgi:branched-chain amino acid transport system ATP-binding protein
MIWIEHDMQMVADLADRIHVLNYGRTLASGPPHRVLNDPGVINAYLGRAQPNQDAPPLGIRPEDC